VSDYDFDGPSSPPNYAMEKMRTSGSNGRPFTLREELVTQIAELRRIIANKTELLDLLDANPAIEKFQDLLRR